MHYMGFTVLALAKVPEIYTAQVWFYEGEFFRDVYGTAPNCGACREVSSLQVWRLLPFTNVTVCTSIWNIHSQSLPTNH